jgi:FeS assembly protein IscX
MTDVNSQFNKLYWDSSYEIVLCLMEAYPDIDLDSVGTEQLCRWIVQLPRFADDPMLVNEHILNEILREWYEEVNSL